MPIVTTLAAGAAATLSAFAIVTVDQTALRAAPHDSAAQQAVLWQGEALEVRGQRMDYLQVYDHRRERAGYVLASTVRTTTVQPQDASELLSVLRFVRDTAGAESLGLAYAAAYLKAVPANAMTAEPLDALGTLADRLAQRASARQGVAASTATAAHLDVARYYGVVLKSYEHDGTMRVCYDGDAFERVLSMPGSTPPQRARAALGLTRAECVDPDLSPSARFEHDQRLAQVLDRVDVVSLPETLKNRLRLRRASVWSSLAFGYTRRPAPSTDAARAASQRALQELAAVNKAELTDDDKADYALAAIRTGASRWAAEPVPVATQRLQVRTEPGLPGQTCVLLVDARGDSAQTLLRRCTWGTVWPASASASPNGQALALAVQPLTAWREVWVFRRFAKEWRVDVLPPAAGTPLDGDVGYTEFAGWIPGANRLLLAREARIDGRVQRGFEVVRLDNLVTEQQARAPRLLAPFAKWQDPSWKQQTVILR